MAIQNRRGQYTDFDPSKMVAGEFAVVQSGDENTTSGKAVYMAFGSGDVQRLVTDDEVSAEISEQIGTALDGKVDKVEGKGLSTNDYSNTEKNKVADLQNGEISVLYGTTTTSGATQTKTVSCSDFVLRNGALIAVHSEYTNTADAPKLNINNTGAKDVYPDSWPANATMLFRYNASSDKYEMLQTSVPSSIDGRYTSTLNASFRNLSHYATCSDSGSTETKTAYIDGYGTTPIEGAWVVVRFSNTNTVAAPRLKLSALGTSCYIKLNGKQLPSPDYIRANGVYFFVMHNGNWEIVGDLIPTSVDGIVYSSFTGNTSDITHYAVCSASGSSNKSVDINGYKLVAGAWIAIRFTQTNTHATPQLSVGSTALMPIKYRGQNLPSPDYIKAGGTYLFIYDGTYWEIVGDIDTSYRPTLDADGIAHL